MNEKLQYASMLEMPTNSCNITYKPIKKRKRAGVKRNSEQLKQSVLDKVNQSLNLPDSQQNFGNDAPICQDEQTKAELLGEQNSQVTTLDQTIDNGTPQKAKKHQKGFGFIIAQLFVIGGLIATILITNIRNENSGLNVFFKSVLAPDEVVNVIDERTYKDFSPVFNAQGEGYQIVNGVATKASSGSIYSTLDGTVKSVNFDQESGLYSIEISHCDNFSSKLEGLDLSYVSVGSKVFTNIPIGYSKNAGSTTCFISSNGAIISNFEIVDNAVIWAV